MDFLPVSVRITDGGIVLVGNSREAVHKAKILHRFTDKVTVIAPTIPEEVKALPFIIKEKAFEESDLEGVRLLFVSTGDSQLNLRIKALATKHGILTSICDDPCHCDFISPAISRQPDDNLTIAVGSDAKDVRRAIRVRNRINELISNKNLDIE